MNIFILRVLIFLMPCTAMADRTESIGEVAGQLMEPVTILSNFIGNGSIVVGVMSLFGALMRYMQYRVNPLASPISTVIVLFILGIVLICLPFTYLLTGAGIPFSATNVPK